MHGGSAGTVRRVASRYEVLEKLGEGGIGVVFKARDLSLNRLVALKFLRPALLDSEDAVRRFLREARAISALNHPHIATIYSIEEHEGERFLALEYLPGGTLEQYIRGFRTAGRQVPLESVIEYGLQVARALGHAHRHGIVHRDVKPSNVLFTEESHAKLVDFGLALGSSTEKTRTGVLAGTIPYMSPEQAQCRPVDHRSDIFSFGVMLYQLASGERPFDAQGETAMLEAVVHRPTPSLAERRPDVPEALERVVQKATGKDPADRYSAMDDVVAELTSLRPDPAHERDSAAPTVTSPAARRQLSPARLRPGMRIWAAAGILALLVIAVVFQSRIAHWLHPLPAQKQIAVLPFVNVGGEAASEAFCDGLFETLTSKLTQVKRFHQSLRVVPATEVRREKVASAADARRRFGVNLAVSGSVQRFRDAVRLTVSLVDTRTLSQLRSETIDTRMGDASALQDGVFVRTAAMLELELQAEARTVVQTGGTRKPSAYYLYVEGLGHLARYDRAENLDRAAVLFDAAVQDDPEYALAWTGAGTVYWRKYQQTKDPVWLERARSHCNRALELAPELVPARVLLGQIRTGQGHVQEAIAEFERALALDPVDVDAYRALAGAYERSGRPDRAEATYRRAIELRPQDWASFKDLGVFYFWNGRLREAESCFRRVIELAPDSYWGYRNLGAVYCSMGRFGEAITQSERSISILPTAPAYSNLGATYFMQGRFSDAARAYEQAIGLGAADERLLRGNLAEAYRRLPGSTAKAASEYGRAMQLAARALEVNPQNAEIRASLALYAIGLGDRARALAEIARAQDASPGNMNVLFRAALVNELAGNRRQALAVLGAAVKNGYPRSEVDHHPDLAELRRDPHYQEAVPDAPVK